ASDPQNAPGREVLRIARELISIAYQGRAPIVLDPFAGGGAIPLEATRLGCQSIANDYNPVAYLILRATCEFPQKYGQRLIGDVEHWARVIRERVHQRVAAFYSAGEDKNEVIGYLWCRTIPCSNPSCRAAIPMFRSSEICNLRNGTKNVFLKLEIDAKNKRV